MTLTETASHLERDAEGVLRIRGKGYKAVLLAGEHVQRGWDAAELHRQHPDLTLGEIHSVLAYYYDHAEEFQAELAAREQSASERLGALDRAGVLRSIR